MTYSDNYIYIYSKVILEFRKKLESLLENILNKETTVFFKKNRVQYFFHSYPLHIVVFEHPRKLGFFNKECYEIGINKALIFSKDETFIKNILRHEIAHFIAFIKNPDLWYWHFHPHGKEFQEVCKEFGWGNEVSSATATIEEDNLLLGEQHSRRILEKVEKLLALSSSSSIHESESATIMANKLLMKHNLESYQTDDDSCILKRIFQIPRSSAKIEAICSILRSFFVYPVFNYCSRGVYIEISGKRTNVEIAEYVGRFLEKKMDLLWKETKKNNPYLKGITCKNSFFTGIARGYLEKIQKLQKQSHIEEKALMVIENTLTKQAKMIYPRLTNSVSKSRHCELSSSIGKKEGENLDIHKGLKKESNNQGKLLT